MKRFVQIISAADSKPPIPDASHDVVVRLNKQVMLSPEFMELWRKIKQKTTYRVQHRHRAAYQKLCPGLKDMPPIPKARIITQTADIQVEQSGVHHVERENAHHRHR